MFDFKKWVPHQWKTKMPDDWGWETHSGHAYKDIKEAYARGEVTKNDVIEFEIKNRESIEQREFRWKQYHQMKEAEQQQIKDFQGWKSHGKSWLGRILDQGRHFTKWWWTRPKKSVGKGKMKQSSITGGWSQEYVPDKTRSVRDWLQAASHGEAFKGKNNFNPDTLKMNKPTPEMQRKSDEAKKERQRQKWEVIMTETDNFGRGWHGIDRSAPGRGGGKPKQVRVTFSDKRVYKGKEKTAKTKTKK